MHNRLENFLDADSHLRARIDRFLGRDRENLFQLPMDRRHVRIRQIDLVDDRHNRQPLLVREMDVRHRLRLHALRGIDDEQRAFTGRERPRNFIGKIDMPRRIEQIQPIFFSRFARVTHRHRMRLDRDPALALEVHRIEQLVLLVALVNRARALEQSIRQRGLAVIDMRDDAKIARQLDCHESRTMRARSCPVNCRADAIHPCDGTNLTALSGQVLTSAPRTRIARRTPCSFATLGSTICQNWSLAESPTSSPRSWSPSGARAG